MDNKNKSSKPYYDVRYSRFYGVNIILVSFIPIISAVDRIISLKQDFFQGTNFILPSLGIIFGLLFFYMGITQAKRRYFRLDKENKILMVFGGIGPWSTKYPYDFIYLAGGKFHMEKDGVKKKFSFLKYTCNRNDLKALIAALGE